MDIYLGKCGNIAVLELRGEMSADDCDEVRERLLEAMSDNQQLVIDVEQVPYMDSTSIGTLMSLARQARSSGGEIKLAGTNRALSRILSLVTAEAVFDILPDVGAAVDAFQATAGARA